MVTVLLLQFVDTSYIDFYKNYFYPNWLSVQRMEESTIWPSAPLPSQMPSLATTNILHRAFTATPELC